MAYNANMNVADIRAGLLAGDFTAREVAEASFKRIEELDGEVHAFLELTEDAAFEQAAKIDEALANGTFDEMGPLAGVPVAFKDNMNYEGTHTTCSSLMLENYVSPYTATCVAKTIEAGGIPLGKLNMDEFAFGSSTETSAFGPTKNPWDLERVPGGSSGGSAASVAAGLACVTLGSDTGGSIRQPAAFCGIVGVKPTYGMVSRYGVVAFGSSLDQVGPFARSVRDAPPRWTPLRPRSHGLHLAVREGRFPRCMRAGRRRHAHWRCVRIQNAPGLTDEVKARVSEATEALREAGAEIVEVELPHADAAISAYYVLGPCEAFSNLARFDSVRYGYCAEGHKDLGSQYEAKPRCRLRHGGQSAALCWAATCFRAACTRNTIIRLSRCARLLRRTTRLHTRNATSFSPPRARVPHSSSAKSAIQSRCTCLTFHGVDQYRRQRRHERAVRPGRRYGPACGRAAYRAPVQRQRTCSALRRSRPCMAQLPSRPILLLERR